jgi:hypothetical protein
MSWCDAIEPDWIGARDQDCEDVTLPLSQHGFPIMRSEEKMQGIRHTLVVGPESNPVAEIEPCAQGVSKSPCTTV